VIPLNTGEKVQTLDCQLWFHFHAIAALIGTSHQTLDPIDYGSNFGFGKHWSSSRFHLGKFLQKSQIVLEFRDPVAWRSFYECLLRKILV
jgi:hypothetical protein